MKKLRVLRLLCAALSIILLFCAVSPVLAAEYEYEKPDVPAAAFILMEPETGTVLYSENETERRAPASMTKMMTALLIAEDLDSGRLSEDDVITVTQSMFADVSEKSSLKFQVGEEITVIEALSCALIASVNEACNMLAEASAGTVEAFVNRMNAKAAALGCNNTHFANAHGLPNNDHYSTAEDMLVIFLAASEKPVITNIEKQATHTVPATNMSDARNLKTTNRFLLKDSFYYYENALYGKTGYTDAAGYCLASCAEKDSVMLVSVVMGCEGVKNDDGSTTMMNFIAAKRLYEWGFENFGVRTIISTSDLICEIPVTLGDGANSVVLRPDREVKAYMNLSVPLDSIERETELFAEELEAPVNAGEVYGRLTLKYGDETLGDVDLVANSSVSLLHIEFLRHEIKEFFGKTWVKLMFAAVALIIILYIVYLIYVGNKNKKAAERRRDERMREQARRAEEARRTDYFSDRRR